MINKVCDYVINNCDMQARSKDITLIFNHTVACTMTYYKMKIRSTQYIQIN